MSRYMSRNGTDGLATLRVKKINDGGSPLSMYDREKVVGVYPLNEIWMQNFIEKFNSGVCGNNGLTYKSVMKKLKKNESVYVVNNDNMEVILRKCAKEPNNVKIYFEPKSMQVSKRIDEIKNKADESLAFTNKKILG
ncbi:hypothetical protein HYZ41_02550 [archaeon]|nr:hypothetical protein [archaeon]